MVNPIRGEAIVKLDAIEITIAITMDGVAKLSAATGYPTIDDLCARLTGGEIATTRHALGLFTQSGKDVDGRELKRANAIAAALDAHRLGHSGALTGAFATALAALFVDPSEAGQDEKNG